MLSVTVPPEVRKIADRFKSTVDLSFGNLCALFALHLFGFMSLSEAVRHLAWSPSVSSLSRAVQNFSGSRFMRRLRASVLRKLGTDVWPDRFCYAIDDVPVEKFGKGIFRIGSFRYHGGSMMRGQRIMVLALVDRERGVALPLAFEVCTQRADPEHRKGHEIAVTLVTELLAEAFPNLAVVLDSWFDSVEMMAKFDALKVTFVVECKSNRCVKRSPSPFSKWHTWKKILGKNIRRGVKLAPTENTKEPRATRYVAEGRIFIRGRTSMLKAAAVYNRASDGNFFAVYATNSRNMAGAEIWSLSRARWHIEEMFRILKQDFSFGKLPAAGKAATEVSICLPFALLASIQLERCRWTSRSRVTVGSVVKEVREKQLNLVLSEFQSGSKRPALSILQQRRRIERNNKKPVNSTANRIHDSVRKAG